MKFLKKVKECFPSAQWGEQDGLPVYVGRHGAIDGRMCAYSLDYPFVGNARRFIIDPVGEGVWNEQLIPWPCFVVLVARPEDEVPVLAQEHLMGKFFFLVYADENGIVPFRLPKAMADELVQGFQKLREEIIPVQEPTLKHDKWFVGVVPTPSMEMISGAWDYFRSNGDFVSAV